MSRRTFRRTLLQSVAVVAAIPLLVGGVPGPAQAEPTSKEVRVELDKVTKALHAAQEREAAIVDASRKLERRVAAAEAEQALLQKQLAVYARHTYMAGQGADPLIHLMSHTTADSTLERLQLLEAATKSARGAMHRARAVDHELRTSREALAVQRAAAEKVRAELAVHSKKLTTLLNGVAAKEKAAQAAQVRETFSGRANRSNRDFPSGKPVGGYHCPVGASHHFTDTWGAPRPGGRRHKGTDVFAPYGSPAYAVNDGTIQRVNSGPTSGLAIQLRAVDGNVYFYAHEASVSVRTGQKVKAGQVIGRVGTSGNARGSSAHVHFELWAGGGAPINPYPFLRRVC